MEIDEVFDKDLPFSYLDKFISAGRFLGRDDEASSRCGFMHAISAIGTKFQKAEVMGPQSQKNVRQGDARLSGSLYFDFR